MCCFYCALLISRAVLFQYVTVNAAAAAAVVMHAANAAYEIYLVLYAAVHCCNMHALQKCLFVNSPEALSILRACIS